MTFVVATFYVATLTFRYLLIQYANEEKVKSINGKEVKFSHPLFETIAGYIGEFSFCLVFYLARLIFGF